jgi:hypothetical protein
MPTEAVVALATEGTSALKGRGFNCHFFLCFVSGHGFSRAANQQNSGL